MTSKRADRFQSELNPCPFCGFPDHIVTEGMGEYWVHCEQCGASSEMHNNEKSAVTAWNKRTPIEAEKVRDIPESGLSATLAVQMVRHAMSEVLCAICGQSAVCTCVHVPVCVDHMNEYEIEARKYLPENQRPFFKRLMDAGKANRERFKL